MATLTGQTVAASYEQLLSLPDGGGNTDNLVVVTDGDAGTTFAMQLSTTTICIDNPTTSSATEGGALRLQCDDGAVMASGHRLGVIEFSGAEDTSSTITTGARIEVLTDAAWSASENGADMVFYTTDGNASQSEVLRLTADNKVGIGTNDPDQVLHLHHASSNCLLKIDAHTNTNAGIQLAVDDGAKWEIYNDSNGHDGGANTLIFKDDGEERMVITQDGYVGIGFEDPIFNLQVSKMPADAETGTVSIAIVQADDTITDSPRLHFRRSRGTVDSPTVTTNNSFLGEIFFSGYDNDSFDEGARIYAKTDATWAVDERGTEIGFQTRTGNGALTDRLFINSNGTSTFGPAAITNQATVVVTGTIFPSLGYYLAAYSENNKIADVTSGSGTSQMWIGNQQVTTSSDERIKKNIIDTKSNGLDVVNKFRAVDFEWDYPEDKNDNNINLNRRGPWTGFLAQEAVKVAPYAVNAPLLESNAIDYESENIWMMDYQQLVPILTKAIQELSAKVDALENA